MLFLKEVKGSHSPDIRLKFMLHIIQILFLINTFLLYEEAASKTLDHDLALFQHFSSCLNQERWTHYYFSLRNKYYQISSLPPSQEVVQEGQIL